MPPAVQGGDGRIAAHRDRIADQVAFVAHALADQVRVCLPLGESLVAAAQVTPDPLRPHLHETANDLVTMRALLDGTDQKLRGWEWGYLNRLYDSSLLTLNGHTGWVLATTFDTDGTRLVTGSDDQTAKIWDAMTGAELFILKGHKGRVVAASFNADGTRVVTGSDDQTAKIWDAMTGAELFILKGHKGRVVVPADAEVVGDGADGHVGEQAEGVAFEGVGEAAVGPGEADRGLADEAAVAAAEPGHGQPQFDGLAADGHGADDAVFGPVADDVGGLAAGAAVVLLVLDEVQREDAVVRRRPFAAVLSKSEGAVE
jgi:WD domain, G-beta repeat